MYLLYDSYLRRTRWKSAPDCIFLFDVQIKQELAYTWPPVQAFVISTSKIFRLVSLELFSDRRWRLYRPSGSKLLGLCQPPPPKKCSTCMKHSMHVLLLAAYPAVHFLLLKSSMLVIYVPVYLLSVSASSQMSVNKIKFMIREGVQNYYFFVFVEKSEILGLACFIFVFSKQ